MEDGDVTDIKIPYPDAADRHLRISVGACRLKVRPGDSDTWVLGSYRDPSGSLPCRITQEGGTTKITQNAEWSGAFNWPSSPPTFDLALGKRLSYALTIETGASENILDLGGLPLSKFTIKQGAGKITVDFSAPNPEVMKALSIGAGAGALEVGHLANANAADITADGGAAAYKLDFGGGLRQDTRVKISTGMSSVEITIPSSTAAKVKSETVLGSVDVGDGFMKKEGAFWNEAALAGAGPALNINATVALGALRIRTL